MVVKCINRSALPATQHLPAAILLIVHPLPPPPAFLHDPYLTLIEAKIFL